MDKNIILQRSENATFQVVAGEAIVIRMDTGAYYSLNEVGTDFWQMLDGRATLAEQAAAIAAKYDRKATEFVGRLRACAAAGADASQKDVQQLADEFDVPSELVSENLPALRGADADANAASLISEFTVPASQVTEDLLELAAELLAEQLIEVL